MSLLTPHFRKAIENLPLSPELGILHLRDSIEEWNSLPPHEDDSATRAQLNSFIRKFVRKHNLDIPLPDEADNFAALSEILDAYGKEYRKNVVEEELDELIEGISSEADAESFGYAQLNQSEKERIHGNISRIREMIGASDLTDRKKNALYDRLNQLASEVDKSGTKTDRFFAFMGDAAFVLGDMATKAKPFTTELKDMIKTIGKARSRKEGSLLPPGEEVLTLPAPEERENNDAD
ncbi:hypothetical protein [Rhizobium sp. Rhizsp42]|uniref:hypothetical protein n=1 Tax=Rhizobium sp. Rhizsp42 TaxID=3243034 RepID=UPI0039B00E1E